MPFNVCDKNGKYLGLISRLLSIDGDGMPLIALTNDNDYDVDSWLDYDGLERHIGQVHGFVNMFGKLDKDKVEEKLQSVWADQFNHLGDFNKKQILKFYIMQSSKLFNYNYYPKVEKEYGYLFIDTNKVRFKDESTLIINDEIDYMQEDILNKTPIFGKIVDYPVLSLDIMGISGLVLGAGLADLGGKNHTHITKLNLLSGNLVKEISIPFHLNVKKDMPILIYFEKNHITNIYVDGVIYNIC